MYTKAERRRVARLKRTRAYLKAYEDVDFLHREDLRPARLQLELLKPELILQEQGILSTVVVFGSTHTGQRSDLLPGVRLLERRAAARPSSKALAARLAVARRVLARSRYYDEAREFARLVSSSSQRDGGRELVIVTGGGPGIMEAANRGAHDAGCKSIGLNITLPEEQEPNPYITPELCFLFHYFALRKMHFMMRARAMVAFPGGYGTMDELFETLTLVQTGKVERLPIILFGRDFWKRAIDFEFLRDEGVIAPRDLSLFRFAETARQAWGMIRDDYRRRGKPVAGSRTTPRRAGAGAVKREG